jgi:CheY-like chemotaxis protein
MTGKRILIVEDEGIVARDMEKILTRFGFEVAAVAYSGGEAIRRAQEEKPDLVLMDIVLKGEMDGIEAAERIRAADIPVVYLTAYADAGILNRAGVTEPYGYILKPFRERELHAIIEIAFYKHAADRERKRLLTELRRTLARVRTLEGLLPICSFCKRIRDGQGRWHEISQYISEHSRADFTHGICPDCLQKYYSSGNPSD